MGTVPTLTNTQEVVITNTDDIAGGYVKYCAGCHKMRSREDFTRRSRTRDGLETRCRDCMNAKAAVRRQDPAQREYHRQKSRQWRADNPDRARDQRNRYAATNRHIGWEHHYRQRCAELGLRPLVVRFTEDELVHLLGGKRCADCGTTTNLELDHRVPIAAGGAHIITNCAFRCSRHNRAKVRRSDTTWITGLHDPRFLDQVRDYITTQEIPA